MFIIPCPNCYSLECVYHLESQSDEKEADASRYYECICKKCRSLFGVTVVLPYPEQGRLPVAGKRVAKEVTDG